MTHQLDKQFVLMKTGSAFHRLYIFPSRFSIAGSESVKNMRNSIFDSLRDNNNLPQIVRFEVSPNLIFQEEFSDRFVRIVRRVPYGFLIFGHLFVLEGGTIVQCGAKTEF